MENDDIPQQKMPWWVKVLIILDTLPILTYPKMLSESTGFDGAKIFLELYPLYVPLAAVCAWISWKRRPDVTWLLLIVMLLSHFGMWYLILY